MLTVERISAGYGDFHVLDEVELRVDAQETVALIGTNGAGKTTLMRSIMGQLRVRRGRIEFKGREISAMPVEDIVECGLTMVPEGRALFPFMTVLENLELGSFPKRAKLRRRETLEFVFELLPRLKERRGQLAGSLSGGEQQMCAIGRALMACPELLILDEPSLGLAPRIVNEIFQLVRGLGRQGVAVLIVEQHVHHALKISDRGYVLDRGRIVLSGPSRELLDEPDLKKSYMGFA